MRTSSGSDGIHTGYIVAAVVVILVVAAAALFAVKHFCLGGSDVRGFAFATENNPSFGSPGGQDGELYVPTPAALPPVATGLLYPLLHPKPVAN